MSKNWGVGNRAGSEAFDKVKVGEEEVDLIHGEHPHSRSDNTTYARFSSGAVEGFDGHRILHEIVFKDYNYLKESDLSGSEVRKGGTCTIKMNGVGVCEFFYRDVNEALINARSMIQKIYDIPIQLYNKKDVESLKGRRIYYREHPAVIDYYIEDQGCLIIRPDFPDGRGFPLAPYQKDDMGAADDYESSTVKVEIWSPHIWWWREEGQL